MPKPIFTSLAPNVELDDAWLATRLILQPWRWSRGTAAVRLENQFCTWLPIKHAFTFSSGRAGLFAILKALDLKHDDEVLLQAYTCVAVPDPVLWVGATPVYVDCDERTFNMSLQDLERKITMRSRVLIIQHTFGLPADLDALMAIARKHKLFVIEDCAHALGAKYHGKYVGTFGDAAFFSFGRDKVISSVFGGMAITNDTAIAQRIRNAVQTWRCPPKWWMLQQLLHPIVMVNVKFFWRVLGLGKLILVIARILHLTSKAVYGTEKKGGKPRFIEKRMTNVLAQLALHQFQKLERFNAHRRKIAKIYDERLGLRQTGGRASEYPTAHIYLRYTLRTPNARRILQAAKKQNIYLGDWYTTPIAPPGVDYTTLNYQPGSCPVAEKLSEETINLPTDVHISENDAQQIAEFIIDSNI